MSITFTFTPPPSFINKSVPSFSISQSSIRSSFTPSLPPSFRINRHKDFPFVLHSINGRIFRGRRRGVEDYSLKKNGSPNQEEPRKAIKRKRDESPPRTTPHDKTNRDIHRPKVTPQMQNKKEPEPYPNIISHDENIALSDDEQFEDGDGYERTDTIIEGNSSRDDRAIEVNFEKGNGKARTADLLFSLADVLRELEDHLLSD